MKFLPVLLLSIVGVFGAVAPSTNIARFPSIALNAQTNVISDNGNYLTWNGNSVAPIFINATGTNYMLLASPNRALIGQFGVSATYQPQSGGQFEIANTLTSDDLLGMDIHYNITGTNEVMGVAIQQMDNGGGWNGPNSTTLYVFTEGPSQTNATVSALYNGASAYGVVSDYSAYDYFERGNAVPLGAFNQGFHQTNYAVIGYSQIYNGTNRFSIGGAFASYNLGSTSPTVTGVYVETGTGNTASDPVYENGVLVLDSRNTGYDLIAGRTNNGTRVFTVASSGLTTAAAGFKSTAIDAAVHGTSAGWTNTFGKAAVIRFDGSALIYNVFNNALTSIYTNTVAVGHDETIIQSTGKILFTSGSVSQWVAAPF